MWITSVTNNNNTVELKHEPKHDVDGGVQTEEQPDDEEVTPHEHFTVFQQKSNGRHHKFELYERGEKPRHPVDSVRHAHDFHHLWKSLVGWRR